MFLRETVSQLSMGCNCSKRHKIDASIIKQQILTPDESSIIGCWKWEYGGYHSGIERFVLELRADRQFKIVSLYGFVHPFMYTTHYYSKCGMGVWDIIQVDKENIIRLVLTHPTKSMYVAQCDPTPQSPENEQQINELFIVNHRTGSDTYINDVVLKLKLLQDDNENMERIEFFNLDNIEYLFSDFKTVCYEYFQSE